MNEYTPSFHEVIALMPQTFDAHDFILTFVSHHPISYFSILRNAGERVFQANALISNHLKNKSAEFEIEYLGKVTSLDIYQNPAECALFHKLN